MPEHRQPPERGRTIAILLIWAGAIALFLAAALLLHGTMREPVSGTPGMYVSTIGYPPNP